MSPLAVRRVTRGTVEQTVAAEPTELKRSVPLWPEGNVALFQR